MNIRIWKLLAGMFLTGSVLAQKQPYLPAFIQDTTNVNGAQFSWDKTYESNNFILIWGNTVGTDPVNYTDPALAFDPASIADTLEMIYDRYRELGFLIDTPETKKLAQYKIPVFMYCTWGTEPGALCDFADAGGDGFLTMFRIHPLACLDGAVLAHEFTHCLQEMILLDSLFLNDNTYPFASGAFIYAETHAQFMRHQIYPHLAGINGMDWYPMYMHGDWKNTYLNDQVLQHIQLKHSIEIVNRMWMECLPWEYPLQTYKRILGISQSAFNDDMFEYARRFPTADFGQWGTYMRQDRENYLYNEFLQPIQNRFTILSMADSVENRYTISPAQAPEDYGYNIIPLHPVMGNTCVLVKFKGHMEVNDHAGWRYGFVTEKADGTVNRYDTVHVADEDEFFIELTPEEEKLYLVVMGAPTDSLHIGPENDTWKGYPKHYRYPYELTIAGAFPEGHQPADEFRTFLKWSAGHLHSNGNGWVSDEAVVDANVFIGEHVIILGNSVIQGENIRIEGTAIVKDAQIGNNVHIGGNVIIMGGSFASTGLVVVDDDAFLYHDTLSDNAHVTGRAAIYNYTLTGSVIVGGDVTTDAEAACDNGVYYNLTNFYTSNPLACDNRTADHPENVDVNDLFSVFNDEEMQLTMEPPCWDETSINEENTLTLSVSPNPFENVVQLAINDNDEHVIRIMDLNGNVLLTTVLVNQIELNLEFLSVGMYGLQMDNQVVYRMIKQ